MVPRVRIPHRGLAIPAASNTAGASVLLVTSSALHDRRSGGLLLAHAYLEYTNSSGGTSYAGSWHTNSAGEAQAVDEGASANSAEPDKDKLEEQEKPNCAGAREEGGEEGQQEGGEWEVSE